MGGDVHHNECMRKGCCERERIHAAHRQCPKFRKSGCINCPHCQAKEVDRGFGRKVFASSFGSVLTSSLLSPFDVIKVRQQASGESFATTVRTVLAQDGVRGLWRGLVPGLTMAMPASTAYIALYEALRDAIAPMAWHEHQAAALAPPVAGFTARMMVATLVSPLELVRTKMQVAATEKAGTFTMTQGLRHIVAAEGYRGLFRGLTAAIARDAPFSAVYWTAFESMKRTLATSGVEAFAASDSTTLMPKPSLAATLLSASMGGAIASVVTNPMDVVKTKLQTVPVTATGAVSTPSTWQQLRMVVGDTGVRGLFAGLAIRTLRIVPATALFMTSYEVIRNLSF